MKDLFNRVINPGDSFLRIEQQMGGSRLRYYFFAGYTTDRRVQVQEYGGVPRVINQPSCQLILLTPDLLEAARLTPPALADVIAGCVPKPKKSKTNPIEI